MSKLNIIILAGGESSRFWPLNEKNSYPFLGKTNIDLHVERFGKIEGSEFTVIANNRLEVSNPKVKVLTQEGSGMAGAVSTALKTIDLADEVLILNANDYYDDSLIEDFIKKSQTLKSDNTAMIVGYRTKTYFPGGYLKLDGDNITGIVEKPGEGNTPSDYVNIVFHYFPNGQQLFDAINGAKSNKDDVYEVALDSLMNSNLKFKLLEYKGEWKTIKYPWQVLDVMEFFLKQIKGQSISPNASVSKNAQINGDVIIEEGVKVFDGAIISGPCYIGKNSIIANGALVRQSIIGDGSVVGFATEVARSYFKSNVWLHKNYVGDSIFENNVGLGSNTVTGNLRLDEQTIHKEIKGEKINTLRNKLGSIIGSDVRIGINVNLMPGVSVGSNSFIGPNVNVENDVPDKRFIKLVQELQNKENKFDIKTTSRDDIKKHLK